MRGTIRGAATSSATRAVAPSGFSLRIIGTGIVIPVGADGTFEITGLSEGDLRLRLAGNGVQATLVIAGVDEAEEITVVIRVRGATATLRIVSRTGDDADDEDGGEDNGEGDDLPGSDEPDDEDRRDDTDVPVDGELGGTLSSLSGPCPTLTFMVNGKLVETSASTLFRRVVCELLADGQRVAASGPVGSDGIVEARKIQLLVPTTNLRASLSSVSGTCPLLELVVGSDLVLTDLATRFDGVGCGDFEEGMVLDVRGHRQSDGSLLAERVRLRTQAPDGEADDDEEEGEGGDGGPGSGGPGRNDDEEQEEDEGEEGPPPARTVNLRGPLSNLGGGCPSVTFQVEGRTVVTTSATRFHQVSCASLTEGMNVRVQGQEEAGQIVARTVSE